MSARALRVSVLGRMSLFVVITPPLCCFFLFFMQGFSAVIFVLGRVCSPSAGVLSRAPMKDER